VAQRSRDIAEDGSRVKPGVVKPRMRPVLITAGELDRWGSDLRWTTFRRTRLPSPR